MINTTNPEQAKRLIKKEKSPIMVKAQDPEFNRKLIEYGGFHILLSPETSTDRKDNLRSMNSGLNHVLAKLAAKNKIAIGLDLKEISHLPKREKALRLARVRQNIKIRKKAKVKINVQSFKDERGASALLMSLGSSTQQSKSF